MTLQRYRARMNESLTKGHVTVCQNVSRIGNSSIYSQRQPVCLCLYVRTGVGCGSCPAGTHSPFMRTLIHSWCLPLFSSDTVTGTKEEKLAVCVLLCLKRVSSPKLHTPTTMFSHLILLLLGVSKNACSFCFVLFVNVLRCASTLD